MTYSKISKCKKCGNTGHNRSNKQCPAYDHEEAQQKREEKARRKEEKKQKKLEEEAKVRAKEEELRNALLEIQKQKGILLFTNMVLFQFSEWRLMDY